MSKRKIPQLVNPNSSESKAVMTMTLAAVILALGLVASNYFVKSLDFHRRVFSEKSHVAKKLKTNQESLESLRTEFLTNEKTGPTSDQVFASLPTSKDFPQTSATLESIIKRSGVELQSVNLVTAEDEEGSEDGAVPEVSEYALSNPEIAEMSLSVEVTGSYENFREMLNNLEKSMRVFRIDSMEISGADDRVNGTLQIKTYYQQAVDNSIKTEVIKR